MAIRVLHMSGGCGQEQAGMAITLPSITRHYFRIWHNSFVLFGCVFNFVLIEQSKNVKGREFFLVPSILK